MTTMHHYAIYETATGKVVGMGRSTNLAIVKLARDRLMAGQSLYEGTIDPNTTHLPNGRPSAKPATVRVVTAGEVKDHAGRLLRYTDWYVTRMQETAQAIPAGVLAYRQAVRDASDTIEAMDPIPENFIDAQYWPVSP